MSEIEGFILIGGASRRMGQAKANLTLDDATFIELAAAALSEIAPRRISLVGDLEDNSSELPLVRDELNNRCGERRLASIFGVHAALLNSKAEWTLVTACDLPFVSGALLVKLATFIEQKCDAVVPVQADAMPQPLCAFYRRETCLPIVEAAINDGDWSLRNLLRLLETRYVGFEEISDLPGSEYFFINVNTPEDYTNARKIAANSSQKKENQSYN